MNDTDLASALEKRDRLLENLSGFHSLLLAFSGGVDSTYLAYETRQLLGERCLAVTARSPIHPSFEIDAAGELARRLGLRHLFIDSGELELPVFRENPPDRCYHCKRALFSHLVDIARREGLDTVVDGSNLDDLGDYRPGMKALEELEIRSPLREAGLTKSDIRALSRRAGLETFDKPAFACLASRFPYGDSITDEGLAMVEQGEAVLRTLEFRQFRIRHHGKLARIEIAPEELDRALDEAMIARLSSALKSIGYTYVTLDLEGYRTGSLNEVLGNDADSADRSRR